MTSLLANGATLSGKGAGASAGAAAAPFRSEEPMNVYHISKREIGSWGNFSPSNRKSRTKIGAEGKPIGFWYAHNTSWENITKSEKVDAGTYKYKFSVVYSFSVDSPSPTSVLMLTADNFDAFLKKYHTKSFIVPPKKLIEKLIYQYFYEGDSALIPVLPEEVQEKLSEVEGDYEAGRKILKVMKNGNIIIDNKPVNDLAAKGMIDAIKMVDESLITYDWPNFWNSVSRDFAGVEFDKSLIFPRKSPRIFKTVDGDVIEVSWLRKLDIVSGCIFDPQTYLHRSPSEFKVGGRRKTRRRHRLLGSIPR
jgi:hypothetical protein